MIYNLFNLILSNPVLSYALVIIFALCIASFTNLIISRVPVMVNNLYKPAQTAASYNLAWPPSHCDACKHKLTIFDLIPILSFISLKGKCRYCEKSIGIRQLLVEIALPVSFCLIMASIGFSSTALAYCIFLTYLVALAACDLETGLLPDLLTLSGLWLGLLFSLKHTFISPDQAILASCTNYLFFWIIAYLYLMLKKQHGMGMGDCKMMAMIGAWIGIQLSFMVIIIGSLCALLANIILLFNPKYCYQTKINFGPYLSLATLLVFFLPHNYLLNIFF